MMNKDFIATQLEEATYKLKEGTSTSYYRQEGTTILPNRVCYQDGEMARVSRAGRNNLHTIVGQFLSNFTKSEESPYKIVKPYKVRTQIWQIEDYPQFIGYGTIGITTEGGIKDTNDLVVLSHVGNKTIRISVFAGMATPEGMLSAFQYLSERDSL